jgi:nitrate reductase NapE component
MRTQSPTGWSMRLRFCTGDAVRPGRDRACHLSLVLVLVLCKVPWWLGGLVGRDGIWGYGWIVWFRSLCLDDVEWKIFLQ